MNFRVIPISSKLAEETRETLFSPQYKSLKADVSVANGYGPCRSCLRVFKQGEDERIYLTYNAFEGRSTLPDPGPIFIHRNRCREHSGGEFPPDLLALPLLLESFGPESLLLKREAMNALTVSDQIGRILADGEVRFINLRNTEAGCFVARVERVER